MLFVQPKTAQAWEWTAVYVWQWRVYLTTCYSTVEWNNLLSVCLSMVVNLTRSSMLLCCKCREADESQYLRLAATSVRFM